MRRIAIMVAVLLALVAAGVVTVVSLRSRTPSSPNENTVASQTNGDVNAVAVIDTPRVPTETREAIIGLSRRFAERYGSWTTDQPFANLKNVQTLVTSSLAASFQRLAAQPSTPPPVSTSVTSRAYAINVVKINVGAGTAETIVSLRRTETKGFTTSVKTIQDLRLQLLRENDAWLVNFASWGQVRQE